MPSSTIRTFGRVTLVAALSSCVTEPRDEAPPLGTTGAGDGGSSAGAEVGSAITTSDVADGEVPGSDGGDDDPGGPVDPPSLPPDQQSELDMWLRIIAGAAGMTTGEFLDLHAVPWSGGPAYDPLAAANLDLVQDSPLALDDAELALLSQHGFVISDRFGLHNFADGYHRVYINDLPVYVSADSILYAFHRSYDRLLMRVEQEALVPELTTLLGEMRTALQSGAGTSIGATGRADADLFTAVALGLLLGEAPDTVAGADAAEIAGLIQKANAHSGTSTLELFGVSRTIDFSQFEPRGHYLGDPVLERYFRCMMWLGRIDLRILEAQPDHSLVFNRRQLEGAYVLRATLDATSLERWLRIDDTIRAFVGEPDSMIVTELDALLADLDLSDAGDLDGISGNAIAQAIYDGQYGTQRISSHIMINGLPEATMPLSSSFTFLGQRYVVDSHVFSNVVFDRVQGGGVYRMLPDPLDVGFAALGNDQAGLLLESELDAWSYAPDLHVMRLLVDAHPSSFWEDNLYNLWLSAIRTLSPTDAVADPAGAGLPAVAGTEAWGRRLLNAQAASWAELRHDTLLYAKQSYTGGAGCEYPDAYVDPYPEFYAAIEQLAVRGQEVVASLDLIAASDLQIEAGGYFAQLEGSAAVLRGIAENEVAGLPLTAEQLAFINDAVTLQWGCANDPDSGEGWYLDLFFGEAEALTFDPTIADVHTQPTDPEGVPVGRVLHVGTGRPRLMVVTTDGCTGPSAYVGVASSYFEQITENFERLDDEEWNNAIYVEHPPDVPWMADLVAN